MNTIIRKIRLDEHKGISIHAPREGSDKYA